MSTAPASTTDQPSRTARANALRLVNQADELVADVLPTDRWEPDARRVKAFLSSEAFERYLRLYLQAMDLDGAEPAYPWNLASTLRRFGRSDLAVGFIGRAVRVAEELRDEDWANADAYFVLAETAIHAGQDDLAFVAIVRAIEQAADEKDAHNHAIRLLTALAEARRHRHGGESPWPVASSWVVALGTTGPARAPSSSEEFAEQVKKAVDRTLKKADARRARAVEST